MLAKQLYRENAELNAMYSKAILYVEPKLYESAFGFSTTFMFRFKDKSKLEFSVTTTINGDYELTGVRII